MKLVVVPVVAGLVSGTLDLAYAFAAYALVGVAPIRILQSIASGIQGRAAYEGGVGSAVLGAVAHYGIVVVMAAVFVLAWQMLPLVRARPILAGMIYGAGLFFVMNYVVVPLSNSPGTPPQGWFWIGGLAVHILLVGGGIGAVVRATARTPA